MKSEYLDCDALCVGLSEQAGSLDPNHMCYIFQRKKHFVQCTLYITSLKPSEVSEFCQAYTLFRFSHTWHGHIWLIILLFLIISYLHIYTYIKTLCITQTFSLMLVYLLVITKNDAFNL